MTVTRRLRATRDNRICGPLRTSRYQQLRRRPRRQFRTLGPQRQKAASPRLIILSWPPGRCIAKRADHAARASASAWKNSSNPSIACNVIPLSYSDSTRNGPVNPAMPLSALIADGTLRRGPHRRDGGGPGPMAIAAAPRLHRAGSRTCAAAGEPFDLAPQRSVARARSTIRVEARRG